MARDITQDILDALAPYLDEKEKLWMSQPEMERLPTLPTTNEGKINVRAVVREAALKPSWEQHFYRKPAVRNAINAVAEGMGLMPIGSRAATDTDDAAARAKIARKSGEAKRLAEQLAEALGIIDQQKREIARLRAQIAVRDETGIVVRTSPLET